MAAAAFGFFGLWYAFEVGLGYDSHAYWAAAQHMDRLYNSPVLARDAYLYSPLFAQVIWPVTRLPWPLFGILWSLLAGGTFVWLLRPLRLRWFLPAFVATLPEVVTGNVYALMAAALVLGVASGPPWVFLGLTKIVPGGIGVVWLSLTRQWRALLAGAASAVVLVGLSALLSPGLWRDWVEFLLHGSTPASNSISSPLLTLVLTGTGLALVVVAAFRRSPWLLAVAAILLSPTIGLNTLTLLAAVPRLRQAAEPTLSRGVSTNARA